MDTSQRVCCSAFDICFTSLVSLSLFATFFVALFTLLCGVVVVVVVVV